MIIHFDFKFEFSGYAQTRKEGQNSAKNKECGQEWKSKSDRT